MLFRTKFSFFQLKKGGYYFGCPQCGLIFRRKHTRSFCPSGLCLVNLNHFKDGLTRKDYLQKSGRLQRILEYSKNWSFDNIEN